jgi:uncharacterized membrane protein YfcA
MPDLATNILLSIAVFAGAFVSSLAGFAFSAVAGAILLRIFQPMEAVPLMMACSIGVQAANLWALRRNIQWEGSLLLVVGGALGIPVAIYLLQNADTHILRVGFGIIVALYAGYMLFRPTLARGTATTSRRLTALIGFGGGLVGAGYMLFRPTLARGTATTSRRLTALIGFGGGLVGGLTAMPGAIPTIWCDMRGLPKSDQRGLVQPFIAIMQVLALALLLERQSLSPKLVIDFAISLPALFAGSVLGIVAFRNIDEVGFRRTILVLLLISGASLALA